jgi:uncharacterized membrane protein YfcA
MSLAVLAMAGRASASQFETALVLMPSLVVGAILSHRLHDRIGGRPLRAFVLLFAIASGAVLLIRN